MFCPQCGTRNEDESRFCVNCGKSLEGIKNASELQKPQTSENNPIRVPKVHVPEKLPVAFTSVISSFFRKKYSSVPVIDEFKRLCMSPIAIISVVSYVLMTLLNFANSEKLSVELYGAVSSLSDIASAPLFDSLLDFIDSSVFLTALIMNLPTVLISIGLCMVMCSAILDKDSVSSSGFGLMRLLNTVQAVFIIIVMVLSAIVLFVLSSKMPEPLLFVVTSVVMLLALGFSVFCLFRVNDSIDCIRYALDRRIPATGISNLVTFLAFAVGVLRLFAFFAGEESSTVNLLGAVAYLGFGILIVMYKNRMEALRYLKKDDENSEASAEESGYEYKESYIGKIIASIAAIAASVIVAVIVLSNGLLAVNPDVDERIVGKWRYNSNAEAVMQFKENGVYIGNEGTDKEERGTFTTENGVIYITIDGEEYECNYRVINDDRIEIERKFYNSNWKAYYEYVEYYRVT